MSDEPFYTPGHARPPRQPRPGLKQWQLRRGDRVIICEFRDDTRAGAGIDAQLLEKGEILVSTRCLTAERAHCVATCYKQDQLRGGWTE